MIRDPEKRRQYMREYMRTRFASQRQARQKQCRFAGCGQPHNQAGAYCSRECYREDFRQSYPLWNRESIHA